MAARLPMPTLRLTAAALLLAVGVVASSGSAAASCGDYLTINGKSHAEPMPDQPAKPCHGPNCSAAPAPAETPLTVPVQLSPAAKELAVRSAADAAAAASGRRLSFPDSDGRPIRRPAATFDPPRIG